MSHPDADPVARRPATAADAHPRASRSDDAAGDAAAAAGRADSDVAGAEAAAAGGADPGAAADDALLAASGRLAWLETMRQASRVVRHDLANVLTGISFFSSELQAELPEGTPGARDAAAIGDEVARGIVLLDRLLELWREPSEAGVLPLDAAAVVDRLAPLLAIVAAPCELTSGPLESIVVRASRRALEEALLVLVLDARAAGGPIRVSVEAIAAGEIDGRPAGRSASIRVIGEGSGLGDHGRPPMPSTPGVASHDAALALALAHRAAHAAGGTARAEGQADGGVATTLLLPEAVSRHRRDAAEEGAPGRG